MINTIEIVNPINVLDVNTGDIGDLHERKAVAAMRATALFLSGDRGFDGANIELMDLAQATEKPPTMTYGDIVFQNNFPAEASDGIVSEQRETYVMSSGEEISRHEAGFYLVHRRIEEHLGVAVSQLLDFPLDENQGDAVVDVVAEQIAAAGREMRTFLDNPGADVFGQMRKLFVGLNGHPGPSGLYSAAIPNLDMLLHGGLNIQDDEKQRMQKALAEGLYPKEGGSDVLASLLSQDDSTVAMHPDKRAHLVRGLNLLRGTHTSAVRTNVPEVMLGSGNGTGGVTGVPSYLRSKLVRTGGLQ